MSGRGTSGNPLHRTDIALVLATRPTRQRKLGAFEIERAKLLAGTTWCRVAPGPSRILVPRTHTK